MSKKELRVAFQIFCAAHNVTPQSALEILKDATFSKGKGEEVILSCHHRKTCTSSADYDGIYCTKHATKIADKTKKPYYYLHGIGIVEFNDKSGHNLVEGSNKVLYHTYSLLDKWEPEELQRRLVVRKYQPLVPYKFPLATIEREAKKIQSYADFQRAAEEDVELETVEERAITITWKHFCDLLRAGKGLKERKITDVYREHRDCMDDDCWYRGNMDRLDELKLYDMETLDDLTMTMCNVCEDNGRLERLIERMNDIKTVRIDPFVFGFPIDQ